MTGIDTLFRNARLADGRVVDIAVKGGQIASLKGGDGAKETVDLGKRLVLPGLVEGHIHLDKGFIGEPWKPHRPCTAGFNVRERVEFEKQALANARPVPERAAAMIDLCVAQGTTHMRSHVDIDPQAGLSNLEHVAAARDAHKHKVSIQIVAFPQSGIVTAPDTVRIERLLPGPIERVWSYLTESEKRGTWLARGDMDLRPGGTIHFSGDPNLPESTGRVLAVDALSHLSFAWGGDELHFDLEPDGDERTRLTLTDVLERADAR